MAPREEVAIRSIVHCFRHSRSRNYVAEMQGKQVPREETSSHPLRAITVSDAKVKRTGYSSGSSTPRGDKKAASILLDPLSSAMEGSDPLSALAADVPDPLSQIAAQMSLGGNDSSSGSMVAATSSPMLDDTFEPWSVKRLGILAKYTTSEKLSITTSFLSGPERAVAKAQQTTVTDKVRTRLEQLDDFEEGSVQEMLNLSQQEYISRIEELNSALCQAWDQDQRVKALKIAIQCAKLLADVSVIQFYPSKFVLVTDILDTFGRLVYDRIKNKAQYIPKGSTVPVQLPENFTPDEVPESAKETCRNWFFKIASIRELIPRFYVEAAILKCYSFLTTSEYSSALRRLGLMTRGIGDPLVAIHSRCYLCRVGIVVAPEIRDHIMPCFDDFLFCYTQMQSDGVQNLLALQKLEMPRYLTLYSPALDWILQCLAHQTSEAVLCETLNKAKKQCNSALLLNSIMSAFKPEYISSRSLEFTDMIRECEETGFPKFLLYRSLGACLVLANPPKEQHLPLLNEVWKVIMRLKLPSEYITCAEIWIEFVTKNFTKREVNTILSDIIKHMTPDRAFEDHYPQLQSVMSKVLVHMTDFGVLFSMDKFLPFLDMFQKESIKVEVCKNIMEAYSKSSDSTTSDPVITNALMYICKTMHDHVNALSLDDEIRLIGSLINSFISSVSFGRDVEQQLSFYVEARAAFSNIDHVLTFLVQRVNQLAMETRDIVGGAHSRKTASFVRACAAYCFITIPSLHSILGRLNLYLVSGQVALLNGCISQADAFFKAMVSLLPDVPRHVEVDGKVRSMEPLMLDFLNNFISLMLVIPDNTEQGVLYLVRGLLNVLNNYTWDQNHDFKTIAYMNVLCMLAATCQESFIYHIDKVDSNDALYGNDPKFLSEVNKVCEMLVEQILAHLSVLDSPETHRRQSQLALEFFNRIIAHGDLSQNGTLTLANNLWSLAQKHGQADKKAMARTFDLLKQKAARQNGMVFGELLKRLGTVA